MPESCYTRDVPGFLLMNNKLMTKQKSRKDLLKFYKNELVSLLFLVLRVARSNENVWLGASMIPILVTGAVCHPDWIWDPGCRPTPPTPSKLPEYVGPRPGRRTMMLWGGARLQPSFWSEVQSKLSNSSTSRTCPSERLQPP